MYTKLDYIKEVKNHPQLRTLVNSDPYRLRFHLMPPTGWLNDPNGLCVFQGTTHIYHQYSPFTALWGMKTWGHYTTKDWIHFTECEPFLFPDIQEDKDGVYSGSAFVKDNQIHFFYTGNVKYLDKTYDYIMDGREQNTIKVISKDGFTHGKKHCLMKNEDYPNDMSKHIRDPKVFEVDGIWYMVLGARSNKNKGCVLIYRSLDFSTWDYHMRIETDKPFGYMWECPDLVKLDETWFLICCPQGVAQEGIHYANVYQCGYFVLDLNLEDKTYHIHNFYELDRGFDIYATQSYQDESGRRILLAWMGIPDADYHNEPTVEKGWHHALTMPRVLTTKNNRIIQQPLKEMKALRTSTQHQHFHQHLTLPLMDCFEIELDLQACQELTIQIAQDIQLLYKEQIFTLQMKESGCGRTSRSVALQNLHHIHIFVDTSAIEIFLNHGEETFTSRCYRKDITCTTTIHTNAEGSCTWHTLGSFQITHQ